MFELHSDLTTMEKLEILADAAKYDVACTSSGVNKKPVAGGIGSAAAAGICHSFSADGRCISLLKVLMTNVCIYDCKYCVNRRSNDVPRAIFAPRELADLTMHFYKRNYIEGLFLSSGVIKSADTTTELMIRTLQILREEGCGADCASYTELLMADAVGFKENEIMFSSNVTPAEDFRLARKLNVIINLDDITHIDFLEKVADIPTTISCRFNPGGHFAIENNIMDNPGDAKYGGNTGSRQRFINLQTVRTERLAKIQLQHGYAPIRRRLMLASHSEIIREISASTMEIKHKRAAAPSPPGV